MADGAERSDAARSRPVQGVHATTITRPRAVPPPIVSTQVTSAASPLALAAIDIERSIAEVVPITAVRARL